MRFFALVLFGLGLLLHQVHADDQITLKVAGVTPASHWFDVNGIEWWTQQIAAQSNGRIKAEYYPVGQLGKPDDLFNLGREGVVDVAELSTAYVADKLPLSGVVELPGLFDTACEGSAAFWQLVKPGGMLAKAEFEPAHVRVLFASAFPPYKVFTTEKPVRSLADFAGMKLRTNGAGVEMIASRLGAVSVRMTNTDLYQSLSRRTLDGVFFALLSARPYDVQTLTKNVTLGVSFGSAGVVWIISDRKWNALPPDLKAIMQTTADTAATRACQYADEHEAQEADTLKAGGMNVIHLSADARAGILAALEPVAADWARVLDRNGKQGSATLAAFKAALEHH